MHPLCDLLLFGLLTDTSLSDDVEDISSVACTSVAALGISAGRMDGTGSGLLRTLIHIWQAEPEHTVVQFPLSSSNCVACLLS